MSADEANLNQIALTVDIVSAFVSNNSVQLNELGTLIQMVHASLMRIAGGEEPAPAAERKGPSVSVRKSVTPDFLICLEDGKKYKSLKRHLRTAYGMSPDEYRMKWNLPRDYPMVAPAFAFARSALARKAGLGRSQPSGLKLLAASKPAAAIQSKKRRGRPRKAETV